MKVEEKKFVAMHYTLTLENGEKVDSSEGQDPMGFIQGSGQIIEGLDEAVLGREVGEKFTVSIPPEKAYGPSSEEMHREIPRENFPADAELNDGQGFTATGPHGPVSFRVVSVDEKIVMADFNHVLAGETLNFEVEITETREPQAEELAQLGGGDADGCAPSDCGSCGGGCG
jgi:FKBP-type peptidyl-prolyl cis-trans isomerase SlyD